MSAQLRLAGKFREQASKVVSLLPSQRRFSKVRLRASKRGSSSIQPPESAERKESVPRPLGRYGIRFELDGEQIYQLSELRRNVAYCSSRVWSLLGKQRLPNEDMKLFKFLANEVQSVGLYSKILGFGGLAPEDCKLAPFRYRKRGIQQISKLAKKTLLVRKSNPDAFDSKIALEKVGMLADSGQLLEKFRFRPNKQQVEDAFLFEELVNLQVLAIVDLAAFALEYDRDKLFARLTAIFQKFEEAQSVEPWFQRAMMKMNLLIAKRHAELQDYETARLYYVKNLELWGSIISYFSNPKLAFMRSSAKVQKAHYLMMTSACGLFQLGFQTGDANQSRVALSIMKAINEGFAKDRTISVLTTEYEHAYAKRLEKIDEEREELIQIFKLTAPRVFGEKEIENWGPNEEVAQPIGIIPSYKNVLQEELHKKRIQSLPKPADALSRRKTSVDFSNHTVVYSSKHKPTPPSVQVNATEDLTYIYKQDAIQTEREAASKTPLVLKIAKGIEKMFQASKSTAPNDSVADRSLEQNPNASLTIRSAGTCTSMSGNRKKWKQRPVTGLPLSEHPTLKSVEDHPANWLDCAIQKQVMSSLGRQKCEPIEAALKRCKTLADLPERVRGSVARGIKVRSVSAELDKPLKLLVSTPDELRLGHPEQMLDACAAVVRSAKHTKERKLEPAARFFSNMEWSPEPKKELRSLILDHAPVDFPLNRRWDYTRSTKPRDPRHS